MKRASLLNLIVMLVAGVTVTYGQTPASPVAAAPKPAASAAGALAGAPSRVAVIDFNQAVTENVEGKAAYKTFTDAVTERQKAIADKTKAVEDLQTKLKTQSLTLSDEAKDAMTKQIATLNTDLTRMNEDAQRDMGELQQKLFAPIAGRVHDIMYAYAKEMGFTFVFDESTQASNLVYVDQVADITTEIIRRVDADIAKNPAGSKPAAPAAQRPGAQAAPKPPAPAPSKAPAPDARR